MTPESEGELVERLAKRIFPLATTGEARLEWPALFSGDEVSKPKMFTTDGSKMIVIPDGSCHAVLLDIDGEQSDDLLTWTPLPANTPSTARYIRSSGRFHAPPEFAEPVEVTDS